MHPILARPARLGFYLAASLPLGGVVAAVLARPGGLTLVEAAALSIPLTLLFAFLGLAAWYPCRSLPLEGGRAPLLVVTHAAAAALTSAVWVLCGAGFARLLGTVPALSRLPSSYGAQVPALFAAGVLLYLLSVALHYVLIALEATREAERRESQMRLLAREAEIAALKARVQPHFLFNSLNSISALVSADPAKARRMCVTLSDFLRKSLALGERTSIPVGEELALARSYLDVERVRFGDRLALEEEIDPSGDACLVPPLLLQPLIENAVVHGISTLVDGGVVRVETRRAGHRLRIVIENPCEPAPGARERKGLGLTLVRERLAAVYGSEAMFAARRLPDRHLAVLSLPARVGVEGG